MSSKTIPSIEYINRDELKDLIKDKSKIPGKDYLVGGNIPNCINRQSSKIHDIPQIIFTCALSKARGPKCARIYSEELFLNKGIKTDQKVQVLKNGFEGWQSNYKDDPELVENYNKEIWDPDYNQ
ncbi:2352_t:CDS:2 [Diversispora eburnea]|uniref:2352_t:CDS:1 n=1 Tax=Diversispora eburnea TaxID=1213867 RepID=A0A9N8V1S1_9GLOM|nr:2352_t:CDS:2 [Diversispora eburnea]